MINAIKAARLSAVPDSTVLQSGIMTLFFAKRDEPGMNDIKKKKKRTSQLLPLFFPALRSFVLFLQRLSSSWCEFLLYRDALQG